MSQTARVLLVGAGPGDPDLLTVRALRALHAADVVVHDRLVSPEILSLIPPRTRLVPVGKMAGRHLVPQERINGMLVDLARSHTHVVRLKAGDPFVFGRGGEEAEALRAAGIAVEVVPGITAAQGAAASLGMPLTHRRLASGMRYVTGHCRNDLPLAPDWNGLADPETTLVVYMGAATIAVFAERLIEHGLTADLPVLAVSSATTPNERHLVSTLDEIAGAMTAARLPTPTLFVIGRVVELMPRDEIVAHVVERVGCGRPCMRSVVLLILMAAPAAAQVPPERPEALRHIVIHDCGSCHGLTMKGGLGSDLRPETLAGTPQEALAAIILDGVFGTAMPPWRPLLTEAEAASELSSTGAVRRRRISRSTCTS